MVCVVKYATSTWDIVGGVSESEGDTECVTPSDTKCVMPLVKECETVNVPPST